jgi:hypothetical protein
MHLHWDPPPPPQLEVAVTVDEDGGLVQVTSTARAVADGSRLPAG